MGVRSRVAKLRKSALRHIGRREEVLIPAFEGSFLHGRRALITGGTSGIGLATAEAFVRNGAVVVVAGRDRGRVADAASRVGGGTHGVAMDVSDPASLSRGFEGAREMLGSIDLLVNNAGTIGRCTFGKIDGDEFDRVIDTNLRGTAMLSQLVARAMVDGGIRGNILNVASSSSLRPATSAYTMSKWGLRGLTLGMAKVLIPHGIVVNGIAPGPTATPMLGMEGRTDLTNPAVPAGRYATPAEIANMAVVLTSDMGRMVVGDIVYMTGGSGVITYEDMNYEF